MTGVLSRSFLEADACLHYLIARFAIDEPYRFVDVWGRPICTAYYALPAYYFGQTGTRIASLLLALVVGWLAMKIAKKQGHGLAGLALVFTLGQPLVFAHSFSELTELPFAALFAGAFVAYQARQFALMAILVSLTPLSRPEGFGVVLIAAVALLLHRKWAYLPLVMVGLVGWTHAGWELFGRQGTWWRWLPDHWPYATESTYAAGHPLHFIAAMPAVVSPLLFPPVVVGIIRGLSIVRPIGALYRKFTTDHVFRCELLIVLIPLGVTFIHGLLYWRGKMASNGELRYLLTVAPFWGVLAGVGMVWLCNFFRLRKVFTIAFVLCAYPVLVNQFYYKVFPLGEPDDWKMCRAIASYLKEQPADAPQRDRLMASHPGVYFFLDTSPSSGDTAVDMTRANIANPPPNTRLIFDDMYASHNADRERVIREADIVNAGWVLDESLQRVIDKTLPPSTDSLAQKGARWRAYVSPE